MKTTPLQWRVTGRKLQILRYKAEGFSNKAIAKFLGISPHTVRNQCGLMYKELGVTCSHGAVSVGYRSGLLSLSPTCPQCGAAVWVYGDLCADCAV